MAAKPCITNSSSEINSLASDDGNITDHVAQIADLNNNPVIPLSDEGFSADDEINTSITDPKEETAPILPEVEQSPMKRMELGGILVYDAYARIVGSERLVDYYDQNPV